jgi:hypothetical protein
VDEFRVNGNPAGLAERRGSAAPLIQRESCGGAVMATRAAGRVFRAKKKRGPQLEVDRHGGESATAGRQAPPQLCLPAELSLGRYRL